jgi:hypothetical protein
VPYLLEPLCSPASSDDDDHIRDGLATKTLGEGYSGHDGASIVDTKLTNDSRWYRTSIIVYHSNSPKSSSRAVKSNVDTV